MTLREQIEALPYPVDADDEDDRLIGRRAVLDIIDRHRCIPDRDALVRALAAEPGEFDEFSDERLADAIIAALEKP